MKLIKSFQISIIILSITLAHSEKILNDYGNGNKGIGINDRVNGTNNTWVGNQNTIKGKLNQVIGDENQVSGSGNLVEGSNNVVGNISPEEMLKLQNQMLATFQQRFGGAFDFNHITQQKSNAVQGPIAQTETTLPATSQSNFTLVTEKTTDSNLSATNRTHAEEQVKNIRTKGKVKKNQPIIHQFPPTQKQVEGSMLVFRSYGSQFSQYNKQDLYQLQNQQSSASEGLCARWGFCLHSNRDSRWFFTTLYPSFPLSFDL